MILTGGNLGRSGILTGGRLSRAVIAAGTPTYTKAVASFSGSTTRNNFSGWVGFKFTIAAGITVHTLGRRKLTGDSQTHNVGIWNASGLFLGMGTVDLCTGTAGSDVVGTLITDVPLAAGSYFCLTGEVSGGDVWYDTAAATGAAGITIASDAFMGAGTTTMLRNNFTGRVGLKITPPSNQTITHLGRFKVLPADAGSHTIYLTTTGGTVLGSCSVNNSGQPTGMIYAALSSSVALTGGTSYYVLEDETSGGDTFFDGTTPTLSSDFTLSAGVYYDGTYHEDATKWPVGFKYGAGLAGLTGCTNINAGTAGQAYGFPQFEFY
jgi:hypothetical protein